MKRILICFCLIGTPLLSFGQHKTSFGFSGSINFSSSASRSTNSTVRSQGDPTWASIRGKSNYRIAGNFNFRIFDHILMKTGVRYAQVGFVDEYYEFEYPDYIDTNRLPSYTKTLIDQQYIEIPLLCRYEFSDKKISFYSELGVSPHVYFTNKENSRV